MQRITALDPASTTGKTKTLFDTIQGKLGMVPNMMRTMGNSPAVLSSYLSFSNALGEGQLGPELGELIALTVANANRCEYCNAAHSVIGEKLAHIQAAAIANARAGRSDEPKIQAALDFALALVEKRGFVSEADVQALKAAGYDDAGIAEIIGHVSLNIFTNYFNNALKVSLDFPAVELNAAIAV
ncbi:carboxymuconolactone decarboxylase family protein [Chitinophaga pendula]|uniref:carboxymuconolactone decarboxylase family protein n=1 Tax=Chitinophaga TaxID=79328 RepID=UPI000BAFEFD8|nr:MULTISPECIES: carboxymuconolactone decarboxylase family protein [Chitinophaga]ASZ13789.1 peroxidase [Chitinophaga sp. MD30]UCJ08592.1 carboxymuconolactone decarboxylase family protein [Chitinophaga pendula]